MTKLVFERISSFARLPEHAGGGQHENVGMDFFASETVKFKPIGQADGGRYLTEVSSQDTPNAITVTNMFGEEAGVGYFLENQHHLSIYGAIVPTGLRVALPYGYHLRIASRSGLGFKENILAFPGTVDSAYRGEIKIKLYHFSSSLEPRVIQCGEKIAQGIVFRSWDYELVEGEVSLDTSRGASGFGSTG